MYVCSSAACDVSVSTRARCQCGCHDVCNSAHTDEKFHQSKYQIISGSSSTNCGNSTTAASLINCGSASYVIILSTADTGISANCLTSTSGDLEVDGNTAGGSNTVLKTILFPLLTYTAGYLTVWNSVNNGNAYNTMLTSLDMHSLSFVGGYIGIFYNSALTSLDFPALTFVGRYFYVYASSQMELNLMSLTYVTQYFEIQQCYALISFTLPVLTFVGQYFQVAHNNNLASISAPALVKIANNAGNAYAIAVCQNAATFSFSASISHAAAGKPCLQTSANCGTSTTCT